MPYNPICHVLLMLDFIVLSRTKTLYHVPKEEDFKNLSGSKGDRIHANIQDFPYIAKLRVKFGKHSLQCGGTLIASDYILTAAHCIKENDIKFIEICMGSSYVPDMNNCNFQRLVKHIKMPRDKEIDLAVLKLTEPLPEGKLTVRPLTVTKHNLQQLTNICQVMGWGWMQPNMPSSNLLQGNVIRMDNCFPKHICVMAMKNSPCRGDSGGPLICDGVLVGVASSGENADCEKGHGVTIYVSVSDNYYFIQAALSRSIVRSLVVSNRFCYNFIIVLSVAIILK